MMIFLGFKEAILWIAEQLERSCLMKETLISPENSDGALEHSFQNQLEQEPEIHQNLKSGSTEDILSY